MALERRIRRCDSQACLDGNLEQVKSLAESFGTEILISMKDIWSPLLAACKGKPWSWLSTWTCLAQIWRGQIMMWYDPPFMLLADSAMSKL